MSLANAALVVAPTSIAPTGGTALTFSTQGMTAPGEQSLVVLADTDLRLRRSIDVKVKDPKVQLTAPNGYTQARRSCLFKKPKLLANGKITVNTSKVEVSYDIETTPTEIQELIDIAAQMASDADFVPTLKTGSQA